MPLAQKHGVVKTVKVSTRKRLSALAGWIKDLTELKDWSLADTARLMAHTRYSRTAICRAVRELHATDGMPPMARATMPPVARTMQTMPRVARLPLPLPFPPGKAPPAPPLSKDSNTSNTESTESESTEHNDSASLCARQVSEGEEDRQKVREAGRVLKLAPERARRSYGLIVERHGRSVVDQALDRMATRLDAGAVFTAPATMLERIIGDVKAEIEEREENIPYGAMVLDDGTVISRW